MHVDFSPIQHPCHRCLKYTLFYILFGLHSLVLAGDDHEHGDDSNEPKMQLIKDNIYMIQAGGGNIAAIAGQQDWLLIDNDYDKNAQNVDNRLRKEKEMPVSWVINTHWHGDHSGGNAFFSKTANILAHEGVRNRMSGERRIDLIGWKIPASPKEALPNITYTKEANLYFGGHELKVSHLPNGHTDTDSIVMVGDTNIVHLGDHFFAGFFPFIDVQNGGNVDQFIANVGKLIDTLPKSVQIIPGHGNLSDYDDLNRYHKMLIATRAIINQYKQDKLSVEEATKKGLPEKWADWSKGFINTESWIRINYQ